MNILFYLLVLIIAILGFNNDKLKKENYKLKNEIYRLKKSIADYKNCDNQTSEIINTQENKQNKQNEKNISPEQRVIQKERSKNTLILIAGALLIVLAAVVFLLSTWNTLPSLIKVGVLVVLIGVFLGTSSIADKKFGLEQTSKAFFNIAMAYIPLVLFAISIFKLFGNYLSIFGEGKFVYLSISSLFVTILYLFESQNKNNKILFGAGMCFEAFSIFFLMLIFTSEIKLVISIASLIIAVLFFMQSYKYNDIIVAISCMAFQLFGILFLLLIFTEDVFTVIFGILAYNIAFSLVAKYTDLKQFEKLYKDFNKGLFIIVSIAILLSNLHGWVNNSCSIISIINLLLLLVDFSLQGFDLKQYGYILNLTILALVLSAINLKMLSLSYAIKYLIISSAVFILYMINFLLSKKNYHKLIAYASLNFVMLSILELINAREYFKYVPFITTICEMLIDFKKDDEETKYYFVLSSIIACITLNINLNIPSFICLIVSIIVFLIFIKNKEINEYVKIIPMLAIMPGIYSSNLFTGIISNVNISMILSLLLISYITFKSSIKKSLCIETVFSVIYIIASIITFKLNIYVSSIIFMLWSIVHTFTYEKNSVFKTTAYISGLVIYEKMIIDLNIDSLTIVKLIGYLLCLYLITRTVIKPFDTSYKIIEYLGTSVIYLFALFTYANITDAMIFIGLLVLMIILGYYKKIGPLFIVSLFAVVINFFKLTKDFWYSIPWWVYLLLVGAVLMGIAISNEASEKENKAIKNLKEIVKKIKNDVDG